MKKNRNIYLTIVALINLVLIFIPMFVYVKDINPDTPHEVAYASLFNIIN